MLNRVGWILLSYANRWILWVFVLVGLIASPAIFLDKPIQRTMYPPAPAYKLTVNSKSSLESVRAAGRLR